VALRVRKGGKKFDGRKRAAVTGNAIKEEGELTGLSPGSNTILMATSLQCGRERAIKKGAAEARCAGAGSEVETNAVMERKQRGSGEAERDDEEMMRRDGRGKGPRFARNKGF